MLKMLRFLNFCRANFLLFIPLALSAFTHIWNPVGFPYLYIDEDAYMQRAMILLEGHGLRDYWYNYDHPYFGQIFLASIFKMIGYPDSLIPSAAQGDVHSIETIHAVPRVLMGLLAVVDTFLLYRISEHHYNRRIALLASILFAVMPISWLTRRVLLDSILMPFLLSSILFAIYTKGSNNKRSIITPLLSGIFLGISIFTKIPIISLIPLVGFFIYSNNNKNLKILGLWFIPVILIPLIWPIHASSVGEFNQWLHGIYYETHREQVLAETHLESRPLIQSINDFFKIDPILLILGSAGLVYGAIKRDFFILLWIIPFTIFFYFIGFAQYFHVIPILPPLCVGSAKLINDLSHIITKKKIQQKITNYFSTSARFSNGHTKNIAELFSVALPYIIITVIATFGIISTAQLITTNLNSSHLKTIEFVASYLSHNASENDKNKITIISDIRYSWIFQHVLFPDYHYKRFWDKEPVKTDKYMMIFDDEGDATFKNFVETDGFGIGKKYVMDMQKIYNSTVPIGEFRAEQLGITRNRVPALIEVRSNLP